MMMSEGKIPEFRKLQQNYIIEFHFPKGPFWAGIYLYNVNPLRNTTT